MQNNGGDNDMGSACSYITELRYACTFDNGRENICTTNYPKGPEDCETALKKNTDRIPKGSIGRPLKANSTICGALRLTDLNPCTPWSLPMTTNSSRELGLLAATLSAVAITLGLAVGSAGAAQNSGLPPKGSCVPSGSGYYFCNIGGKMVSCNTDHPTDLPRDCPLSRGINTSSFPKEIVGGKLKAQ